MIGIKAVGSYVPLERESNFDKIDRFELKPGFLEDKIGVSAVSRKKPEQETSDLCCNAFEALTKTIDLEPDWIDCLVVCTQNPDGNGLPHTSAVVHRKLGLADHVAAFDISLGCSGYVYSLAAVISFMEKFGLRNGLLFTADPYSKILDPDDRDTNLLFGDAASVTWLADDPTWILEDAKFGTSGKHSDALINRNGRLSMNGRQVFEFSMRMVPQQITELLGGLGLGIEDIDLFLLHQGSKFLIDTMVRRMDIDPVKAPLDLKEYGNTISSSIPLMFEKHFHNKAHRRILISGFGVGLSRASALLTRVH